MNDRSQRHWLRVVVAAAGVLTVAGCTSTMDGVAARDPHVKVGVVDRTLLDVANYPTKPRLPLGLAGDPETGSLLDAQSLAEYVTGPWEVDPTLVTPIHFSYSPAAIAVLPDSVGMVFFPGSPANAAVNSHGFINGFAAGRKAQGKTEMYNIVLRYPDASSAAAVAADLGHASQHASDLPPDGRVMTSVAIPGHPEAVASTYTFQDTDTQVSWNVVQSATAHGPFVLWQNVDIVGSGDAAAALVGKTLDLQGPAIDKYTPVDPAQFPSLPKDPSGMLAKSIQAPKDDDLNLVGDMTVGPHGMLHFSTDPFKAAKVHTDAGMDVAVQSAGWILRARDAAGAAMLLADDLKSMLEDGPVNEAVPNLPGSHCHHDAGDKDYSCVATSGRYEFTVWGKNPKDTQRQTAAQYLMLGDGS